jgi:hypothetical protein
MYCPNCDEVFRGHGSSCPKCAKKIPSQYKDINFNPNSARNNPTPPQTPPRTPHQTPPQAPHQIPNPPAPQNPSLFSNRFKLRMVSKIGLLLVIIGFFMPISCNLNAFEIANALEYTNNGTNILSICLYAIFIFSCIGVALPIIYLLVHKAYPVSYDWGILIVISGALFYFVFTITNGKLNTISNLQTGAYVILTGIIITLLCLLRVSSIPKKSSSVHNNPISNIQSTPSGNFCNHCGNSIQTGNKFCSKCGARV